MYLTKSNSWTSRSVSVSKHLAQSQKVLMKSCHYKLPGVVTDLRNCPLQTWTELDKLALLPSFQGLMKTCQRAVLFLAGHEALAHQTADVPQDT